MDGDIEPEELGNKADGSYDDFGEGQRQNSLQALEDQGFGENELAEMEN